MAAASGIADVSMLRWLSVLLVAALALLLRFYADNFIVPTSFAGAFTSARPLAMPITYNQTCSESYNPHIYGCHPMPPHGCSRKIIDDFISSDDVEVIKGMAGTLPSVVVVLTAPQLVCNQLPCGYSFF